MSAARFHGPVLPSGEVRDLFVVGNRVTYEPQPGAELIASGWIVPGLVDAHCHIGLGPAGEVDRATTEAQAIADRDGGALLIRDAGSAADTRWVQAREDLPRLIRAARHVGRTARYVRGYADEVEPEGLADAVRRQAIASDGWVKLVGDWIDRTVGDLRPSFAPEEFKAAIDAAHAAGAKVTAHCFGHDVLPGLIDARIDCIEHGTGLTPDLVETMAARSIALVPTVAQLELFPQLVASARGKFDPYAATMSDLYARRRETIMSAYEAGVALYAGSDGAATEEHGTLHREIAALSALGLPNEYVLGAASWRARGWLGFTPDLAEGSEADFLVYDRDPLADLSVIADRPAAIVLRGRVIS